MTDGPSDQLEAWVTEGGSRQVAVRELLKVWGAKRRSFQAVDQINRDLRQSGLRVDPPIIDVPIDEDVTLSVIGETTTTTEIPEPSPPPPVKTDKVPEPVPDQLKEVVAPPTVDAEVRMKVSWIPSASSGLERIAPDKDLVVAQAKMLRYDYSQLAVQVSPRSDPLAISWESIAKARIRDRDAAFGDATEPAVCVSWDDDLLPLIPKIIANGFIFVRGQDRTVIGIVTTADLSQQFEVFANPFLLLGEIERGLRVVLDDTFTADELASTRDNRDSGRTVNSAADLTMGEVARFLADPEIFERLGWVMDRQEFIAAIEQVRDLRNEVMHFSPDPVVDDDLLILRNFQQMLQKLALQL